MPTIIEPSNWKDFTITCGAVLDDSYKVLAMTSDARLKKNPDDDHSYFAILKNGVWYLLESTFAVTSFSLVKDREPYLMAIGKFGEVRRASHAGSINEHFIGDASGKKVYGRSVLNEVRGIAGQAYAVGTRRSAYRRQADGVWDCIDETSYAASSKAAFLSIDGFASNDIYAVGKDGEIWWFDGQAWTQLASPTNARLLTVVCGGDGKVYVAGMDGVVIKGPDVDQGFNFFGSAYFNGRCYLSANLALLFELTEDNELLPVDFGDLEAPTTTNQLIQDAGSLYSIGPKHVVRTCNGIDWEDVLTS